MRGRSVGHSVAGLFYARGKVAFTTYSVYQVVSIVVWVWMFTVVLSQQFSVFSGVFLFGLAANAYLFMDWLIYVVARDEIEEADEKRKVAAVPIQRSISDASIRTTPQPKIADEDALTSNSAEEKSPIDPLTNTMMGKIYAREISGVRRGLVDKLGVLGYLLLLLLSFIAIIFPAVILKLPGIAIFALVLAFQLGILGDIAWMVLNIWTFVVAISGPQTVFTYSFYVVLAIQVFMLLIRSVLLSRK